MVMMTLTDEQKREKHARAKRLMDQMKYHVLACEGRCCQILSEPTKTLNAFKEAVQEAGLEEQVRITTTSCLYRCGDASTVAVYPDGIWYQNITEEKARKIVFEHFKDGNPVEDYIVYEYADGSFKEKKELNNIEKMHSD